MAKSMARFGLLGQESVRPRMTLYFFYMNPIVLRQLELGSPYNTRSIQNDRNGTLILF
jgi:hypothetical protein